MFHLGLADGTVPEAEGDPGPDPAILQDCGAALVVEDVSTAGKLDGGDGAEGLGEADHAHVIGILLESHPRLAAVKAREADSLVLDAATEMAAGESLLTGELGVLDTILVPAETVHDGVVSAARSQAESGRILKFVFIVYNTRPEAL